MANVLLTDMQENLRKQFELIKVKDLARMNHFIKECNEILKLLRKNLRQCSHSGTRQSYESRIRLVTSDRIVMKSRMLNKGSNSKNAKSFVWQETESALEKRIRSGLVVNISHKDPEQFISTVKQTICRRIRNVQRQYHCVKIYLILVGEFVFKANVDIKYFHTKTKLLLPLSDLTTWYQEFVLENLMNQLSEFQERDSGWALSRIISLTVNIKKCSPLKGSGFIDLPQKFKRKRAVVNLETNDDACFAWAVVSALYPAKNNVSKQSSYPRYKTVLHLEGILFPMQVNCIDKFGKQNNLSINVYSFDEKKTYVGPIYLSANPSENRHINLLLISDNDNQHFCWIKSLSRLISSQISSHHPIHVCDRCLLYFYTSEELQLHKIDCNQINECAVELPQPDNKWLYFKNYYKCDAAPFVVYADFECLLGRVSRTNFGEKTTAYQHHQAYSVGYYLHCEYDNSLSRYSFYRGSEGGRWLANELKQLALFVNELMEKPKPIRKLTKNETDALHNNPKCHICGEFITDDSTPVRDHCHFTGNYRGPAHQLCNLRYVKSHVIPIIFHNLTAYDAHFIVEQIATSFEGRIKVIPMNKEKYISFTKTVKGTKIQLRFIDSLRFMNYSLAKLASYLNASDLKISRKVFHNLDDERFALLSRKGVFPYDYVDSETKLLDTELPEEHLFYNKLTDANVSKSDYEHASVVWEKFCITNLGEYSDLYLKTDVALLADIFENFRNTCRKTYGLDPAHYFTVPGLAWDAMLKITNIRLELLTDIDMILFVERGIREGVSQCSNRYGKSNNPYTDTYDISLSEKYLMYFDVNNLYGWAMSKYLPYKNFSWVQDVELFQLHNVQIDSDTGYILEVDLEYPKTIHDAHKDLPFCPHPETSSNSHLKKLMTTLRNKVKYIAHYSVLQQASNHGVKISQIHRILQFDQAPWLKSYIDLNTRMRTVTENEFEKSLFKLMNNSVFGKTMENVRKRVDIRLATTWCGRHGANSLISAANFHRRTIFSENFVASELQKLRVVIDKPIYVGMCILDLSKICLYEFHYDYMLTKFNNNCKLLYTDTDSLLYEIVCLNFYGTVKKDIHRFDTSDYPANNVHKIPRVNKKVPGLMKDENNGSAMLEFVGLRSKMYSIQVENKDDVKKAKGVKSYVVANQIAFNDHMNCLHDSGSIEREQFTIQSRLHEVYSIKQLKIALSAQDDKRCLLSGTTDTLPWGYYSLAEQ